MSSNGFPFSHAEVKKVKAIQFGILSPQKIEQMSVATITKTCAFDMDGRPTREGINDQRMGTVDKHKKCDTCGCDFEQCPGHFGHIKLIKPVYHVGFIEECRKVLRCICFGCSKILLPKDQRYEEVRKIKNPKKRQKKLYDYCKGIRQCKTYYKNKYEQTTEISDSEDCTIIHEGCDKIQPNYKSEFLKIIIENDKQDDDDDNQDKMRYLLPEECLAKFKNISDEDCYMLGFNPKYSRPDWMIIQNLAVCPPQVRPSVSVDTTMRCEDDLTFQYNQILKTNQDLKQKEEGSAAGHAEEEIRTMMQFYVATLMNNEISSAIAMQKSGRPLKAISTRLKGKEGRLRGNLMGKRVDFSARSVISPDPNLLVDELGVPLSIAMNLTFPEPVTKMNIDFMRKLVENGPSTWPGAKYIIRDDGSKIDLRYVKNLTDVHLAPGYIVERHLQNGEAVVFNRQPSLHKMSMMCHRAHILPYSTFRLNLSVTTPYNADFDGDEMNLHVPQSYETKAEILNILHVPKQIVSPQSNKPVMGIVQDSLIGVKLFTQRDNFITLDQVMNLTMWIIDFDGNLPPPAILKPVPLWTGKQIFSLIIPKINLVRYSSNHDEDLCAKMNLIDSMVQIDNGELIQGLVCKRTVGNASGGLVHCIWNEFGPTKTLYFLSNCQRVVNNWLLLSGWTVGISDIISTDETNRKIRETMDEVKKEVQNLLIRAQRGKLETQPGKGMVESFEAKANDALNKARETAGKYVQNSLKNDNHLKNMVLAGSKGNVTNISQIVACVGQQNVEGKRIPFNFNRRTLPHFVKDDYQPESRGFVENSYLSGLSPQEYYFHAMGGREGIIDTAVKTSDTGYIQRRLIKALEDVMIKYDGTVRRSSGGVIQFLYGDDGIAGEMIEDQKIETLNMDNETLSNKFQFFDNDDASPERLAQNMKKFMKASLVDNIVSSEDFPNIRIALDNEFNQIRKDRDEMRTKIFKDGEDKQHFPVNILRILFNAKKNFNINMNSKSDLHPLIVLSKISELKKRLILVKGEDDISKEAQSNALKLFTILLNYNLSCKRIIQYERFSSKAFDWVIGEIESRFFQSIVRPGEMVGNIAAQSIGEPATQMTLNTFHFAGVSSKNVTLGVPRLKEIINVAKRLKTPGMTIYLKSDFTKDEREVQKYHSKLEHTTLLNITELSEIYYDPDLENTIIQEDQSFMEFQMEFLSREEYLAKKDLLSPWVLRLELDKDALIGKDISMDELEEIIKNEYDDLDIFRTEDNSPGKAIIRIRLIYNKANAQNKGFTQSDLHSLDYLKAFEKDLLKINIKGIESIKKVYVKDGNKLLYDPITGKLDKNSTKELIIDTDGTNMSEVFQLDEVDFTRVISNDINEINEVLGIEAVRKSLIGEIRSVLRPYDIYVNYRHISILCDIMTNKGILTSITRHGLNKVDVGPIRKCSFEETVDILLEAGLFSEKDNLLGISENILVGQLAPLGTGCFDLLLDLNQIKSAKYNDNDKMDIDDAYNANDFENLENSDYKLNTPPMNDISSSPYNTPFAPNTPNAGYKTQYASLTPSNPNISFTPCVNAISSPGYAVNSYISTPYPNQSVHSSNNNAVYNPTTDHIQSPGPYSPNYDDKMPSDYKMNSEYCPLRTPRVIGPSYYNNMNNVYINSPSSYSPTTPAIRPNSSSPGYMSGNLSSSPRMQESGGRSSQYAPHSPSYNPMTPRYNVMQSAKNSPYYAPGISGGTSSYGGNNNNDEGNNDKDKGTHSAVQSDEEDN